MNYPPFSPYTSATSAIPTTPVLNVQQPSVMSPMPMQYTTMQTQPMVRQGFPQFYDKFQQGIQQGLQTFQNKPPEEQSKMTINIILWILMCLSCITLITFALNSQFIGAICCVFCLSIMWSLYSSYNTSRTYDTSGNMTVTRQMNTL